MPMEGVPVMGVERSGDVDLPCGQSVDASTGGVRHRYTSCLEGTPNLVVRKLKYVPIELDDAECTERLRLLIVDVRVRRHR